MLCFDNEFLRLETSLTKQGSVRALRGPRDQWASYLMFCGCRQTLVTHARGCHQVQDLEKDSGVFSHRGYTFDSVQNKHKKEKKEKNECQANSICARLCVRMRTSSLTRVSSIWRENLRVETTQDQETDGDCEGLNFPNNRQQTTGEICIWWRSSQVSGNTNYIMMIIMLLLSTRCHHMPNILTLLCTVHVHYHHHLNLLYNIISASPFKWWVSCLPPVGTKQGLELCVILGLFVTLWLDMEITALFPKRVIRSETVSWLLPSHLPLPLLLCKVSWFKLHFSTSPLLGTMFEIIIKSVWLWGVGNSVRLWDSGGCHQLTRHFPNCPQEACGRHLNIQQTLNIYESEEWWVGVSCCCEGCRVE